MDTEAAAVSNFARKLHHWGRIQRAAREPLVKSDYAVECPPQLRRRGKHRAKIILADFLKIAHAVIVGHEKHADVAKEFRIGRARVS